MLWHIIQRWEESLSIICKAKIDLQMEKVGGKGEVNYLSCCMSLAPPPSPAQLPLFSLAGRFSRCYLLAKCYPPGDNQNTDCCH